MDVARLHGEDVARLAERPVPLVPEEERTLGVVRHEEIRRAVAVEVGGRGDVARRDVGEPGVPRRLDEADRARRRRRLAAGAGEEAGEPEEPRTPTASRGIPEAHAPPRTSARRRSPSRTAGFR